jgi:RND family efflux transporter MFP subunit
MSTIQRETRDGVNFAGRTRGGLGAVLLLIAATASGCGRQAGGPPPQQTPVASVARPLVKEVVEWDTYSGRLQAPKMAEVVARVSGMIMKMPFEEGAIVKEGDVLAEIDDRPFKADLDSKLADQEKAESALAIATITLNRTAQLRKTNAVAEQDYDNAKAVCDQAKAAVAGAKAAVATSRLNLEWCSVRAPISGRVSDKRKTEGNFVTGGAGQPMPTLLTTVTSITPIYLYVDVDEHSILKYQSLAKERKLLSARDGKVPCFVALENESGFPHRGYIDFMDNHVDANTGTMRVRAVLDNASGKFIPGCYAQLRVPGSGRYRALLVPDEAVGNDQNQHTVLVVDKDDKAQVRPVELGALFGGLRSITSGLSADERIVVNGQMNVRPGAPIKPIDAPIKLEQGEFSDPGTNVAERDPALDAKGSVSRAVSVAMPAAARGPAAGGRE